MTNSQETVSQNGIQSLIATLNNPDGLKRQRARLKLVEIGRAAVPALIEAMSHPEAQVRWEAIEALAVIADPAAAPALVNALEDERVNVRWAASRALIALNRAALPPLLEALTDRFGSVWLRRQAHHILHVLKQHQQLKEPEIELFKALDNTFPVVEEIPWTAEAALEALNNSKE